MLGWLTQKKMHDDILKVIKKQKELDMWFK
jgi:hypothetical protein